MKRNRVNASRTGRFRISVRSTPMIESSDGSSIDIKIPKSRMYINLEVAYHATPGEVRVNWAKRVELTRQPQRITSCNYGDRNPTPPLTIRLRVGPIYLDGKRDATSLAFFINLSHNHNNCRVQRRSCLVLRPRVNSTYTSRSQPILIFTSPAGIPETGHAIGQHFLNSTQNPTGPIAAKQVRRVQQSGNAVLFIHQLLVNHPFGVGGIMYTAAVFQNNAVSRKLKVRIPDAGPPPIDDGQRMLMEIADSMAIQHPADLRLAPASESCLLRGR